MRRENSVQLCAASVQLCGPSATREAKAPSLLSVLIADDEVVQVTQGVLTVVANAVDEVTGGRLYPSVE
ncbi:MAG: hypothetical protein AAFN92_22670, partial [Bacteroidota bacterium]